MKNSRKSKSKSQIKKKSKDLLMDDNSSNQNYSNDFSKNSLEYNADDLASFQNSYFLPPLAELQSEAREPKVTRYKLTDQNAHYFSDLGRVGWKNRLCYSLAALEKEQKEKNETETETEFYQDPNRLLEILISTIILLASGDTVPPDNYMYVELYLMNIRDDNGDHPPNIGNFLKYLNFLKHSEGISTYEKYKVIPAGDLTLLQMSSQTRKKSENVSVTFKNGEESEVNLNESRQVNLNESRQVSLNESRQVNLNESRQVSLNQSRQASSNLRAKEKIAIEGNKSQRSSRYSGAKEEFEVIEEIEEIEETTEQ